MNADQEYRINDIGHAFVQINVKLEPIKIILFITY